MKQAIKKAEATKTASLQATATPKTPKPSETEEARVSNLTKTNLFNRFLEASCDCV